MYWPERLVRRFLISRPGIWYGRHVPPHLDRPLLCLTRGRLSASPGQPVLLLVTTGAKSGKPRATPMIYVRHGERLAVFASNGGRDRHPGRYYNLRAQPAATVYVAGTRELYQAHEATGAERDAYWRQGLQYFEGFAFYEARTRRRIPVMVLVPKGHPAER